MSRRRGGHGGGHGGASHERWLLTYADMITLLLVLFIVLLAMSETNAKKAEELAQSLRGAFNLSPGGGNDAALPPASNDLLNAGSALLPEVKAMMDIQEQLERELAENGGLAAQSVTTSVNQRGLVISLSNSAFFDSGEATLRSQSRQVLETIAGTLTASGRNVMIEGHTDNTPINTMRYPSNWELSTARATAVVRYLITEHGFDPKRLSAAGYGEYYPIVANTSPQNQAKNRRVDIVILRSDLKGQRPAGQF